MPSSRILSMRKYAAKLRKGETTWMKAVQGTLDQPAVAACGWGSPFATDDLRTLRTSESASDWDDRGILLRTCPKFRARTNWLQPTTRQWNPLRGSSHRVVS